MHIKIESQICKKPKKLRKICDAMISQGTNNLRWSYFQLQNIGHIKNLRFKKHWACYLVTWSFQMYPVLKFKISIFSENLFKHYCYGVFIIPIFKRRSSWGTGISLQVNPFPPFVIFPKPRAGQSFIFFLSETLGVAPKKNLSGHFFLF